MIGDISELNAIRTRPFLEIAATLFSVIVYTSANGFMTGGLSVAGRQLGLGEVEIGLILGSGALIGVLCAPVWGYISEVWSRRALLLLAVPMITFGPAAMAAIVGEWMVLQTTAIGLSLGVARLVQAAFGAALIPVAQAAMADFTVPARRVSGMGILSAVVSFGTLTGSALLWLTGRFGLVSGFTTIAAFGILALIGVAACMPQTSPRHEISREESLVPLAKVWPFLVLTFVGFTCYTTVPPIFALRLMDKFAFESGAAASQTGLVLTLGVIAVCAAQVIIAIRRNWNPTVMLRLGSIGIFAGLLLLLSAKDIGEMSAAMTVIGFAVGFLAPAILGAISLLGGRGSQGKIGGLNMAARGLGSALGPVLGTTLYHVSPDLPIIGSMVLIGGVLLLTFILPRVDTR